MANSKLVNVTRLSPNCSKPRNHKIDRLTPHHTAGVLSVESALDWFSRSSTQASCNYVVGNDGRIGLCVDEANRAWTSSSGANDNRAITFEVVNSSSGGQWPVSDKAFNALVDLCVDICQRYGKKKLLWLGNKATALAYEPKDDEMVLTMHQWFASTNCPGPYLGSKFPELAQRVTARLNTSTTSSSIKKQEDDDMTQEQFNKMADSWMNSLGNKGASSWAKDAIEWGKANGLMVGDDKGNIMPKKPLTREEFITVMNRFYDKYCK